MHTHSLARLMLLVTALLLLSACAGAATPPPATTAPPATAAPQPTTAPPPTAPPAAAVTVVHWQHHFEARANIVKELAAEFEKANPNIKIDFQSIPYNDFFQKLGPSLEAGSGPDVFQIPGPLVKEFYDRGQLLAVPADVYAAADIEKDFVPWTIQLLKQGGQYVGFPTDVQPFLVFYNDELFKEAGLDPTKDLETWEDVTNAAIKLTKREGDTLLQAGIDITSSPYQWYWGGLTTLNDKGIVDEKTLKVTYNNEAGYAFWAWLTELVTKHKVDSPEFLTGQDKFALGKAAMSGHEYVYSGSLKLTAPDLKYSLHLLPHAPGRPKATAGTHWAYVVSAQSKHPAEAWAWVKFLTSEAAQRKWIVGGGEVPSRKSLYADANLRADPIVAAGLDAMQYVVPFDDFGWDDVYNYQQAIWDNIVLKGMDVKTAVQEAAAAEEKLYQDKRIKPAP